MGVELNWKRAVVAGALYWVFYMGLLGELHWELLLVGDLYWEWEKTVVGGGRGIVLGAVLGEP